MINLVKYILWAMLGILCLSIDAPDPVIGVLLGIAAGWLIGMAVATAYFDDSAGG